MAVIPVSDGGPAKYSETSSLWHHDRRRRIISIKAQERLGVLSRLGGSSPGFYVGLTKAQGERGNVKTNGIPKAASKRWDHSYTSQVD